MAQPLRIFVSSPGDVDSERRRAGIVIAELRKAYARFFDIEPILWEWEPMLASGHFQDQITPPSETDIVVVIVWSRLGTPLPPKTQTREYRGIDGRVPVTGTEWEFEDALAAQKQRGAPDLLAYRKRASAFVPLDDRAARIAAEEQWERLDAFWSRWFVDRGEFRAAFNDFADLDAFEAKLKSDLRKLIERRIQNLTDREQGAASPTWLAGSPFRGLDAYRLEHAPIFFGRSAMTKAAVEQLTANAERGRGFLLILGASGSGKSSLAQAGVVPALADPGVVTTVGLWRRAVFRPGGHIGGPFAGLADSLVGAGALPELLAGRQNATALARHLRASVDDPTFSILAVLNQIEDAARARGELLGIEKACLVLVVDQMEELFTAGTITADERAAFIRCLDALARSGRVYVLATMRSDYWHRAAETPLLVEMAAGEGRLDLLPATQDEIFEMIRRPTEAAGIEFEVDPVREIGLAATLASEAANEPGVLPLLSFLLDELYKADIGEGRATLTFASMRGLGGLRGAIANRAEAAFVNLSADVQAALPRVLRALVTTSRSAATATGRPAALAQFADGSAESRLVDALLAPQVRLLVADGDGAGARVRFAHEALLTHWERAKRQIAQDQRDLETRDVIERQRGRWQNAASNVQRQLLLRDPDMANAVDLARRWGEELDEKTRGFIGASVRRSHAARRRVFISLAALVAILACLSGIAFYQWVQADRSRLIAEAGRLAAQATLLFKSSPGNLELSALLTVESIHALPTAENGNQLQKILPLLPQSVLAKDAQPYAWAFDGKSQFIAIGTSHGAFYSRLSNKTILFSDNSGPVSSIAIGGSFVAAAVNQSVEVRQKDNGILVASFSHQQRVARVILSSDGRYLLTLTPDGPDPNDELRNAHITIVLGPPRRQAFRTRLFDLSTRSEVVTGNDEPAVDAALSNTGAKLVLSAKSGRLILFNTQTGQNSEILPPSDNQMTALRFSPAERYLIVNQDPSRERIYDLDAAGQEVSWLSVEPRTVAFGADDKMLAATSDTGTHVYQTSDHANLFSIEAGKDRGLAFSPDNRYIVVGTGDRSARVINLADGKEISRLELQGYLVSGAFSPIGPYLATATENTIQIFNFELGTKIAQVTGEYLWPVTYSSNGHYVGAGPGIGLVFEPRSEVVLPKSDLNTHWLTFSPDGQTILGAGKGDIVHEFDISDGHERSDRTYRGHSRSITPDGRFLATGDFEGIARVFDRSSHRQIASFRHQDTVSSVALTADGALLASLTLSGIVTVFDVETKKNMAEFAGANGFSDITFGSTKDLLFVATDTGIAIVDVLKAQTIMTIPAMESPFAVSADGNVLAAVGLKGRLALFDIRSGKEVITLGDVRSSVGMSMSFSKDGQKLAVVVNDYTLEESDVTLYDVPGGGVTDRFNLGGIVRSIFFQRSTEALYVASEIRKRIVVTKIELSAERASQQACALLWRNLKIDEWERYFGGRRYRKTCPNIPEERIQTGVDG